MFSLFNKFVSFDPKVRNHPGPTHTNRNWEDTSTPPCFISSHSGHIRYRNSNRVHMMTFRYPLPVHTRVLHWRASLPRRFFLATSFSSGWLGKQATFSIGKIPINNRPGKETLPTSMERGESPFHSRSSTTTFRPTWSRTKTENCVDRRTKRTNPLVERLKKEREWCPLSPRGHRRRTMKVFL